MLFMWVSRPSTFFFFNDTATTEIYTLSLHDALPIYQIHPADPDSNPRRCTRVPALFLQLKSGDSSPSRHKPSRKTREIVCFTLSERMSRDRKSTRLNSSHT